MRMNLWGVKFDLDSPWPKTLPEERRQVAESTGIGLPRLYQPLRQLVDQELVERSLPLILPRRPR
jgi:hypothetical protein